MRTLSGIEGIWCGKEDLSDDVGSKMIDKLDRRGSLVGFNKYKTKETLKGFPDERTHDIVGVRIRKRRKVIGGRVQDCGYY